MAQTIGDEFRAMADAEKDPQLRKWYFGFARQIESAAGIRGLLEMAEPSFATPADEFDRDPYLINFRNCTLDVKRLQPIDTNDYRHNPSAYITGVIAHDYNAGAHCPQWLRFLERIIPDEEVRAFLQRAVGYSLTGSVGEQCLFMCYGSGANGKSVFLNTLMSVIGSHYAQQADPRIFIADTRDNTRSDLARMRPARFVAAIETAEDKRLDEVFVKTATGGDPIVACLKFREPFQFVPEFKLWLATNHKPTIRGNDYAIWRRIRLIPFEQTIPAEDRDPDLQRKLERESEGILRWAVDGAVEWLQHGLNPPAAVLAATEEYRHDEDQIGQFLADCTDELPQASASATALWKTFQQYTGAHCTQNSFGKMMGAHGHKSIARNGRKVYCGLALKVYSDTEKVYSDEPYHPAEDHGDAPF